MQNLINQVHDETDGQESDADEDHSHRRRNFAHHLQRSFAGPGNAKDKRAPVLAHKQTLCGNDACFRLHNFGSDSVEMPLSPQEHFNLLCHHVPFPR
jgi:hypothetical protein